MSHDEIFAVTPLVVTVTHEGQAIFHAEGPDCHVAPEFGTPRAQVAVALAVAGAALASLPEPGCPLAAFERAFEGLSSIGTPEAAAAARALSAAIEEQGKALAAAEALVEAAAPADR